MEWLPIETAPKDEWILIYDNTYRHSEASFLMAKWCPIMEFWKSRVNPDGKFSYWNEATHWMPLPPPPTTD